MSRVLVVGDDRVIVVIVAGGIPVIKTLRGISRFTEQAFVGDGSAIKTGRIGNLYGVEVYASSLCPWIHCNSVTGTQSVTFTSTAPTGTAFSDEFAKTVDWTTGTPTDTKYRACALVHKDAMVLAEQQSIRTQAQYKQEYLGTLVTLGAYGLYNFGLSRIPASQASASTVAPRVWASSMKPAIAPTRRRCASGPS